MGTSLSSRDPNTDPTQRGSLYASGHDYMLTFKRCNHWDGAGPTNQSGGQLWHWRGILEDSSVPDLKLLVSGSWAPRSAGRDAREPVAVAGARGHGLFTK